VGCCLCISTGVLLLLLLLLFCVCCCSNWIWEVITADGQLESGKTGAFSSSSSNDSSTARNPSG